MLSPQPQAFLSNRCPQTKDAASFAPKLLEGRCLNGMHTAGATPLDDHHKPTVPLCIDHC